MGSLLAELGLNWPKSLPRPAAADAAAAPPHGAPVPAAKPAPSARDERELAELAKRMEGLAARLEAAGIDHTAKVIADRQARVAALRAAVQHRIEGRDAKGAMVAFSDLGAALDALESLKKAHAAHVKKRDAAKAGPVLTALRMQLMPQSLADSRTKALEGRETPIAEKADAGKIADANAMVDAWVKEAGAWAKSKEAYESLNGKKPKVGELEDLVEQPGGAAVLDTLVADLPDDTPQAALIAATEARFGIELEQYDHRKGKGRTAGDKTEEIDPKLPDKDLKRLYKLLGKVPLKDVKEIENIERYTEETTGADFTGTPFGDTVRLFCGRPDDKKPYMLGLPGQVVPPGEKVDPNCAPVEGRSAPVFDFVTLHEVGHAVDDAQGIMSGGRSADAGWAGPSVGEVAAQIAKAVGYDKDWIESLLDSADNKPPAEEPERPKGVSAQAWEKGRNDALAWCRDIRESATPWNDAALCKKRSIGGVVYQESYKGTWVSYKYAARAQGISGYQFRSPMEWFAELYAAYHCEKLRPSHPASKWLAALKDESLAKS